MSKCDLNTECYLVFPFKIKDIGDVLNIVQAVKKNSLSSNDEDIDTVDTTVINDETPLTLEQPKVKRKKIRRLVRIGKETMDFYQLSDILYPEIPSREKRYRKLGGEFERDYRNPDMSYQMERFTKDMNRRVRNIRRRVGYKQKNSNFD